MKTSFKLLIAIFLLVSAAGCASYGPIGSPEYVQHLQSVLPSDTGEVLINGSAQWYPNVQGFNDMRGAFLSEPDHSIAGAVAITSKDFFFLQWNSSNKKFTVMLRLPFDKIKSVELDRFGLNRRVVIQRDDYTVNSFNMTKAKGQLVDKGKTEEVYEALKKMVPTNESGNV